MATGGADILRVLADVAEEHERGSDESLRVVPVLVTDVDPPVRLVREVVDYLGGVLLDATDDQFAAAVPGLDHPQLRGDIQATLAHARNKLSVSLLYSEGTIDGEVLRDGVAIPRPTGGERHLLQIARALNDARLAEHELAVLVYRETILDFDAQAKILELMTGLGGSGGPGLGAVRTLLVVVVSAGLSIRSHCTWPGGVRYSLESGGMLRRHPPSALVPAARRLAVARERVPVFFLAAGFSASSDMPVGNTIRDGTIRRLSGIDADETMTDIELAGAFWDWASQEQDLLRADELADGRDKFASLLALEQVVRIEAAYTNDPVPRTLREFKAIYDARTTSGKVYGDAIYQMQRVLEHDRPLVLVTVNYDELLEEVARDRLDIAVTDDDFERLTPILAAMARGEPHPEGKVPYLKLHGTFNNLESCVATDTVTRSGLPAKARDALLALVRQPDQQQQQLYWIYVGASMRDIDLEKTVLAQPEFSRGAIQETWVSPSIVPSVEEFVARNPRDRDFDLFRNTITETADAFMRAFAEAWLT